MAEYRRLKKLKVNFGYEDTKLSWVDSGHYTPDFTIRNGPGGDVIYVEKKGYFRPEHKRVLRAVKRTHPALDIRLVFYRERKADIKWAVKYGFPWAIGTIPKEWLV